MKKRMNRVRLAVQLFFLVLIALIAVNHTLVEEGAKGIPFISAASTHALCPFGGVVSIYQYVTSGTFVKKIHESAFILMGITFALAVIAGPLLCGWVCPLGTVQELVSRLGRKIFKKKHNTFVPAKIDRWLRFLRYAVLVLVLIMTARSAELLFQNVDPYYALFNFWSGEVAVTAIIALILTLVLSLFIERPFCKYFCPMGAVLGLFNKIRIFTIDRDKDSCISCSKCSQNCPMNINVAESSAVRNHQCISCLECTTEASCPVAATMEMRGPAFAALPPLKYVTTALVVLIAFIGGIGGTIVFNQWSTESSTVPAKITTGEFAGQSNPSDIRGSYSLSDIETAFDVPVDVLARAFGFADEADPGSIKIKTLEEIYTALPDDVEVGTDSVRLFVSLYTKLPHTPEPTTRLPQSAVKELQGKIDPIMQMTLEQRALEAGILKTAAEAAPAAAEAHSEEATTTLEIKGNTTFGDLLDAGLSKEQIEGVLGQAMGSRGETVRDFLSAAGLEFSEYKTELQELIDAGL